MLALPTVGQEHQNEPSSSGGMISVVYGALVGVIISFIMMSYLINMSSTAMRRKKEDKKEPVSRVTTTGFK